MMDDKICSKGTIWKIIPKFILLPLLIWSTAPCSDNISEVNVIVGTEVLIIIILMQKQFPVNQLIKNTGLLRIHYRNNEI